ncbi:MAG: glycoside hydrolase family 2 protein [Pseudomonadota bacterium]
MEIRRPGEPTPYATEAPLHASWRLAATAPHAVADAYALDSASLDWLPALVPGTVAQSLQATGRWRLGQEMDFDAQDWWYVGTFSAVAHPGARLRFEGLATLAEVYLNGTLVLQSQNMFTAYDIDIGEWVREQNELAICFRALNPWLAHRRPRPRWKTRLVKNQQLRWLRTTLLGRMPGWGASVVPVGPWRAISISATPKLALTHLQLSTELRGTEGLIALNCRIKMSDAKTMPRVRLEIAGKQSPLVVQQQGEEFLVEGAVFIDHVRQWFPHTHGKPARYTCVLHVEYGAQRIKIDCGKIGFRSINVVEKNGDFAFFVNDIAIFARGAVWTIEDLVSAGGDRELLRDTLTLARDAGVNMLRIGGMLTYEQDAFYDLCDEFGILVWQDFMFANMDYPGDDRAFGVEVEREVTQLLQRLRRYACIALYCGNNEVEQQAAMWGLPRAEWRNALFGEVLPALCRNHHPGIPYIASTPSGGALPFHANSPVTHYYGVGAYFRPLTDVRRSRVCFASECLGFANVPEPRTVELITEGAMPAIQHPRWKQRVPRDHGAGWDFEDVRDFYLQQLYGIDATRLRSIDTPRYLELSRVVTGEVMTQAYSEWRSAYSSCRGALIWFFKDLWPGAGWGIIDSIGTPKACYYYLKRVWRPLTVVLTDEGLNGLHAHIVNDTAEEFKGTLRFLLLRGTQTVVAQAAVDVNVPAYSKMAFNSDAVFGVFHDVTYAYRFGPPQHDLAAVNLHVGEQTVAEAFYFPHAREPQPITSQVSALARALNDDEYELSLHSDNFLYAVHFDIPGYFSADNYFHLLPNVTRRLTLRRASGQKRDFSGFVEALNLSEPVMISCVASGQRG